MIYKLSFLLSFITSIIIYYISIYIFQIPLICTLKLIGLHFVLNNFSIIIFFRFLKIKFLNSYKKLKTLHFNDKNFDFDFGDELFRQMFLYYKDVMNDLQQAEKKIKELETANAKKEDVLKQLVVSIENRSISVEEDYEELLNIIRKIEKTYDELSINYQKDKLNEENLITKISKVKVKLSEPEELSTTIINEIESSIVTLEKERDNLDKLKVDIKKQQEQFKTIKNNISFDLSNLEQLVIINKNFKSVISKLEQNKELETVYNELDNILNSLKSVDRVEQQKLFKQYSGLNDILSNTIQKIKTMDLILLFLNSLINNVNSLKSAIREIQKEDFELLETKKIRELDKLGELINTYLGTMINFKNDFQSLVKVIHKH